MISKMRATEKVSIGKQRYYNIIKYLHTWCNPNLARCLAPLSTPPPHHPPQQQPPSLPDPLFFQSLELKTCINIKHLINLRLTLFY